MRAGAFRSPANRTYSPDGGLLLVVLDKTSGPAPREDALQREHRPRRRCDQAPPAWPTGSATPARARARGEPRRLQNGWPCVIRVHAAPGAFSCYAPDREVPRKDPATERSEPVTSSCSHLDQIEEVKP